MILKRWRRLTDFTIAVHTLRPDLYGYRRADAEGPEPGPRYPRVRFYSHLQHVLMAWFVSSAWVLIGWRSPWWGCLVLLGGHILTTVAWNLPRFGPRYLKKGAWMLVRFGIAVVPPLAVSSLWGALAALLGWFAVYLWLVKWMD